MQDGQDPWRSRMFERPETEHAQAEPSQPAEPEKAAEPGPSPQAEPSAEARTTRCQWCSAVAAADALRCPSCGASLAERETLGGMVIPGVTDVDPGLRAADTDTFAKLARNSARLGVGAPTMGALMPGGMLGQALVTAAQVYAATQMEDRVHAQPVGDASRASIEMAAKLDRGEIPETPARPERDAESDGLEVAEAGAPEAGAAAQPLADPWADLPPVSIQDQIAGTEFDPWATPDWTGAERFDPWAEAAQPGEAGSSGQDPWTIGAGPWSQDPWATQPPDSNPDPKKTR